MTVLYLISGDVVGYNTIQSQFHVCFIFNGYQKKGECHCLCKTFMVVFQPVVKARGYAIELSLVYRQVVLKNGGVVIDLAVLGLGTESVLVSEVTPYVLPVDLHQYFLPFLCCSCLPPTAWCNSCRTIYSQKFKNKKRHRKDTRPN